MGLHMRQRSLFFCLTVALISCGSDDSSNDPKPLQWDAFEAATPQPFAIDSGLSSVLFAEAGISESEVALTETELQQMYSALPNAANDLFAMPWQDVAFGGLPGISDQHSRFAGTFNLLLQSLHPIANMIRYGSEQLGVLMDIALPISDANAAGDFDGAISTLCLPGCSDEVGSVPADLKKALTALLWAIDEGVKAQRNLAAEAPGGGAFWFDAGGNYMFPRFSNTPVFDYGAGSNKTFITNNPNKRHLFRAASQIAFAVEQTDWAVFRNRHGVDYRILTPHGWLRIRDAADHTIEDDGQGILFDLDLGGSDIHREPLAANQSDSNGVSIAIDLDGNDRYSFDQAEDTAGWTIPPADAGGRATDVTGFSESRVARQGAARLGIAMLFDLGGGEDEYISLLRSQGYAEHGVGVLYDDGGDDSYVAEAGSMGAAQYGIGLLVDAGGSDSYLSIHRSQGYGHVAGIGALIDVEGSDTYVCDSGVPGIGGAVLYPSAQASGVGGGPLANHSSCQGTGFGERIGGSFIAGGVGLLSDLSGDDSYEAGVWAQGSGFTRGVGILSDGGGADTYDGVWYVQGAGAHGATGILWDSGPSATDEFNGTITPHNMHLGAGHDFSVGFAFNGAGDDTYAIANLGGGAGNCNGIGWFFDGAGDDTYDVRSPRALGAADLSAECAVRSVAPTIGLMCDGGGSDSYDYPPGGVVPADDSTWAYTGGALATEHGGACDGSGSIGSEG
jgi:hypothetical protein